MEFIKIIILPAVIAMCFSLIGISIADAYGVFLKISVIDAGIFGIALAVTGWGIGHLVSILVFD